MARIWITGEALIDFVPVDSALGEAFLPCSGGSTYNVARVAARLGADVSFLGAISTDMFGDLLARDLLSDGVDLRLAQRVDHPSTVAFVSMDGENARYVFLNNGSATQLTDHGATRIEPSAGDFLHAGSISLIDDPGGKNIADFVAARSTEMMVSLDPNARLGMIADLAAWRRRMDRLINCTTFLKLSDEDLEVLSPGEAPETYASRQIRAGLAMVVVTLGADGAVAMTRNGHARLKVRQDGIADTVGAGDTVTGAILAQVTEIGLKNADALAALGDDRLQAILQQALTAAWLNCRHVGCNPPYRSDLDAVSGARTT